MDLPVVLQLGEIMKALSFEEVTLILYYGKLVNLHSISSYVIGCDCQTFMMKTYFSAIFTWTIHGLKFSGLFLNSGL